MPDIVISEFMDEAALKKAARNFDVYYDPDLVDKPKELSALLARARALVVRNRTRVDRNLLQAAPELRVIGRLGVGLDNIDLDACAEKGVEVRPATGANDAAVAEWVIIASMMLLRGAFLNKQACLAGEWPRNQCIGRESGGKIMGLIGFGGIGRETAARALCLGLRVVAYDPYIPVDSPVWQEVEKKDDLSALLQTADIVSLHVPLTEETRHLIDSTAISRMKPAAVLINAARGGVLDEKALAAALTEGRIGGAALDVYETEPLTREAADLFLNVPNLVLTPHIAGVTIESNQRVSQLTMENVCAVLEKSP
jgi:(S)-sulfolactate dehydrogenase